MERERSMSSTSSSDSWSLIEEAADEIGNLASESSQQSLDGDENGHVVSELESLDSITSISLPVDLSAAFSSSSSSTQSQHLLVLTTPASVSLVTQTGSILSPEQSIAALAYDPNSNALVSQQQPPKSPPIESTFTFLKDPTLRISFSDSSELKEVQEEKEEENVADNRSTTMPKPQSEGSENQLDTADDDDDEVFNCGSPISNEHDDEGEQIIVEEEDKAMAELAVANIETKTEDDEQSMIEASHSNPMEMEDQTIRTSPPETEFKMFSFSSSVEKILSTSSDGEEEKKFEEKAANEVQMNVARRMDESYSVEEEEEENSSETCSSEEGTIYEAISSTDYDMFSSSSSVEEILSTSSDGEGEKKFEEIEEKTANEVQMNVVRRMDELSDQTEQSIWQRFLDETFCSLKSFERADRIINILIIAMFLTSISSMTILHILENTWIGNNVSVSSSPQHYRMVKFPPNRLPHPSQITTKTPSFDSPPFPSVIEQNEQFFINSQFHAVDEDSAELRQCRNELIETKTAYESKAKILHYVRFKEMEQEMVVNELRRQLDEAKKELIQHQQKPSALSFALNLNDEEFEKKAEVPMPTERPMNGEGTMKPTDLNTNEDGILHQQQPILKCPSQLELPKTAFGNLAAPPAILKSHLLPPPVPVQKAMQMQAIKFGLEEVDEVDDEGLKNLYAYLSLSKSSSIPKDDKNDEKMEDDDADSCGGMPKGPKNDEGAKGSEDESEFVFAQQIFSNWRKYNQILQNLSTSSGRKQMLKTVTNVVVAKLNRTMEKTATAWEAAKKFVSAEYDKSLLFTSTLKNVWTQVENSANELNAGGIIDCLKKSNGLRGIIRDFPFCAKNSDFKYAKKEEKEEMNSEKKTTKSAKNEKKEGGNGEDNKRQQSNEWQEKRAIARSLLRHQQIDHGQLYNHSGRFARWLFARAALREKQRIEQQNETFPLPPDWMSIRQKIRAKLRRSKQYAGQMPTAEEEDWFFTRHQLRQKARKQREQQQEKEYFTEQKRPQQQKNTVEEEEVNSGDLWMSREEEKRQRKLARKRQQQQKKWKPKWANTNAHNFQGEFSTDED